MGEQLNGLFGLKNILLNGVEKVFRQTINFIGDGWDIQEGVDDKNRKTVEIRFAGGGAAALPAGGEFVCSDGTVLFGDSTLFVEPSTGSFSIGSSTDAGFTLPDSAVAEMHYNGPPITLMVRADMAIEPATTGVTMLCSLGIALDGDLIGQAANSSQARAFGASPIGVPTGAAAWLHTSRLLVLDGNDNVIAFALCGSDATTREATSARMQFWQVASAT